MTSPLPTPWRVTSPFGWRTHPITKKRQFHRGTDIDSILGFPILAMAPGEAIGVGTDDIMGHYVRLWHPSLKVESWYMHLSAVNVQKGQAVKEGDVIGWVGETGRATGTHLHLGIRLPETDEWIDPEAYFKGRVVKEAPSVSRTTGTGAIGIIIILALASMAAGDQKRKRARAA